MCKLLRSYKKQCQSYEILNVQKWVKIYTLTWRVFAEPVTIYKLGMPNTTKM